MTTELVGDKAGLESIPYDNALERGDQYKKLFEEVFNFDKVEVCLNPTLDQVLAQFQIFDDKSKLFAKNRADQTVLALACCWVGFKLKPSYH